MCPLRQRDIDLLATKRRTVLLQSLKVTALYDLLSPMYYSQTLVLSSLTSDQFEVQRSLIRISESLPRSSELQARGIWRRSTELLVFRILWHLVFRIFRSSDAGDVHQNFLSSESSEWLLGKSSELADADYLLIRITSSEALVSGLLLARSTSDRVTAASESESVLALSSKR